MTHIEVLRDRAVEAEKKAIAANVAADCILDTPVEPDDTWGADLRMAKYRAQLLFADAYREYAFMNRTALENALLADLESA